jgi:hypothetical protein
MHFNGLMALIRVPVFANDLEDAFTPEVWAQEGLMLLENNMVAANLVHRDFENQIANFGDIVNTRLPANFVGKRKTDADSVTVQDAVVTNVPVPLNQHLHVSFLVKDGEESKGFQSLRDNLLAPAMLSLAQMVDEVVLSQSYAFLPNAVGQLGVTPTKASIIAIRQKMNELKVPMEGRNLIVTPQTEADLLDIDTFTEANKVGDEGSALREGSLGRKYGILHWMSQNTSSVDAGGTATAVDILVDNVGGYAKGDTVLTVDGRVAGAAVVNGTYITIAGDNIPHRVVSSVGAGTPTQLTITPPLARAVADDAIITEYVQGAIDFGAGYLAGFSKELVIDGFGGGALNSGGLIGLGDATGDTQGVLSTPTATAMLLGRPLAAAAADDAPISPGPAGQYNFAFHRQALALVTRPLAAPASGTGALSFVASYNGLSMRIVMTYDGNKQGHLVTADLLCGVKVLDENLGAVMLA